MRGFVAYGDAHGEWRPLLRACREEPPEDVVVLGDREVEMPLHRQLASVFWTAGKHEKDRMEWHDNMSDDHPDQNLHARWCRGQDYEE